MNSALPEDTRPPEAVLIRRLRGLPHQSMKQAARKAGISDTRWRDIENGYKFVLGQRVEVRNAPAPIVAKMGRAVGATPQQFRDAGRDDAAAELACLLRQVENGPFTERQRNALADEIAREE